MRKKQQISVCDKTWAPGLSSVHFDPTSSLTAPYSSQVGRLISTLVGQSANQAPPLHLLAWSQTLWGDNNDNAVCAHSVPLKSHKQNMQNIHHHWTTLSPSSTHSFCQFPQSGEGEGGGGEGEGGDYRRSKSLRSKWTLYGRSISMIIYMWRVGVRERPPPRPPKKTNPEENNKE